MTNHKYILLLIFILILCISCLKRESKTISEIIIGKWDLDSISAPNGRYCNFEDTRILVFRNASDYYFEWWNADVLDIPSGKYFILNNPKRGLKTITFIPDIQISGKDTIRREYINLDILSITDARIVLIEETNFIYRGSLPRLQYETKYIYKKIK